MKYIRTKDGRISYLSREPCEDMDCYEIITSKGTLTYRREDEVIKIANTIEELCDEFVCEHNNGTRVMQTKEHKPQFPFCKDTIDYLKRNNQTYYGAIWTDKGLIFVASMNNDGVLELL